LSEPRKRAAMREWLDRKGYEPAKFTYDQNDEAVVVSVEFLEDQEGDAFAALCWRGPAPGDAA
jgi:hypothetical protein